MTGGRWLHTPHMQLEIGQGDGTRGYGAWPRGRGAGDTAWGCGKRSPDATPVRFPATQRHLSLRQVSCRLEDGDAGSWYNAENPNQAMEDRDGGGGRGSTSQGWSTFQKKHELRRVPSPLLPNG
jgi:hypothetical protein